jgi:prevent-host-death family protein
MVSLTDIHSLTDFHRNAKAYLGRIRRSGRPIVLTVNGKAAAVLHDAAGYQKLLEALDRAEALEGIPRGFASMKCAERRPLKDALEYLGRKYEVAETRKDGLGGMRYEVVVQPVAEAEIEQAYQYIWRDAPVEGRARARCSMAEGGPTRPASWPAKAEPTLAPYPITATWK